MTNRHLQFKEIYDYLNELRSYIKDLVEVNTKMLDRIERLEKDNRYLRQGHLPD